MTMGHHRIVRTVALVTAAALAASGCGDDDTAAETTNGPDSASTVTISANDTDTNGDDGVAPTSTLRGAEEAPVDELPRAEARLLVTGKKTERGNVDFTVTNDSSEPFTLAAVVHGDGTIDGPSSYEVKPGETIHLIVIPDPGATVIELEVVPAQNPNLASSASVTL